MHETTKRPYVLGHSETELRRLAMQSAFWGELTGEVLRRAGIGAGMHVLDIGSGAGDVAIFAARMVGSSGTVLGIDRSEDAVKRASARAARDGLSWCRFSVADVQAFEADQRFHALVGRLVLMHVNDPARTLRSLVRHLRPGGIVAFHEIVLNSIRSAPPLPLVSRAAQWVITAFERAGVEVDMGLKLDRYISRSRLAAARMLCRGPPRRWCRFSGLRRICRGDALAAPAD